MSEEKRFTNKKLIVVSIAFVLVCGLSGVLGFILISINNNYNDLSGDYDDLYIDHLELLNDFNNLDNQYFILSGEHIKLKNDYNALVINLADMTTERDNLIIALADMTTERDDLLIQIDILNIEISVHLTTISGLESQIGDLEDEIIVLEEQAIVDSETIANLNTQIANLNAQITNHLATISGLEADITNHLATISGLEAELTEMTGFRDVLQIDLDALNATYIALLDDYQILFDANVDLQITYDALLIAYDYICNTIKQSILPIQYSIFAEAVRRYYGDSYLDFHPLNPPKWYWAGFARFCRDMILHDSNQYNYFTTISDVFLDALNYGSNTRLLANYIMNSTFYSWLPDWDGNYLSGNELIDIDTIVQWCIDEIDYEYDTDITNGQEYFKWDYIKFPVETAFRTKGDCEDQAILTSAYLESCGFETAIVISHDFVHPTIGSFYHGSLWVHIEDQDAFWSLYPATSLWTIDGGINFWYWVDTTWDVPFGSTPTWLQDYIDYNIPLSWDIITLAICDIGGTINTNVGENTGLTCVMPT